MKHHQLRQFDDFRRNWSYTKSRQNSENREMVNWFTMVLFDVEIRLPDHWVKLWIYRPVSWFAAKISFCKFVKLMISGGIGPIQSQDKTAKKGRWWTGSPWFYLTKRYAFKIIGYNCEFIDLSACFRSNKAPANSSIWRYRAKFALYKVKTKQREKGDGELVHHGRIWRRDTASRSLGNIMNLSTCQLVRS